MLQVFGRAERREKPREQGIDRQAAAGGVSERG